MAQTLRKLRRGWSTGQQGYSNPFSKCPADGNNFCRFVSEEQLAPAEIPPSGAFGSICISGEWKSVSEVYICVGGAWKSVGEVNVCIGGEWKGVTS